MTILVDVHSHLDHQKIFTQIDDVIRRAREAGLKKIITNGVDPATNRIALELASKFDIVEPALGWYPRDALVTEVSSGEYPIKTLDVSFEEELDFIKKQKFIALGEVGLDYQNGKDVRLQKEDFSSIIELAIKLKKPLIVHSRKAESDAVEMLETAGAKKVVMHCFSGNFKLVKKIDELGWSFSIPANIVRSQHFQKLVSDVDISRIMTETDAPYLSPFPDRMNEPAFITESIKKIAELKGMVIPEVENNIFMNFQKMFL